jgi:hypothetical protein
MRWHSIDETAQSKAMEKRGLESSSGGKVWQGLVPERFSKEPQGHSEEVFCSGKAELSNV